MAELDLGHQVFSAEDIFNRLCFVKVHKTNDDGSDPIWWPCLLLESSKELYPINQQLRLFNDIKALVKMLFTQFVKQRSQVGKVAVLLGNQSPISCMFETSAHPLVSVPFGSGLARFYDATFASDQHYLEAVEVAGKLLYMDDEEEEEDGPSMKRQKLDSRTADSVVTENKKPPEVQWVGDGVAARVLQGRSANDSQGHDSVQDVGFKQVNIFESLSTGAALKETDAASIPMLADATSEERHVTEKNAATRMEDTDGCSMLRGHSRAKTTAPKIKNSSGGTATSDDEPPPAERTANAIVSKKQTPTPSNSRSRRSLSKIAPKPVKTNPCASDIPSFEDVRDLFVRGGYKIKLDKNGIELRRPMSDQVFTTVQDFRRNLCVHGVNCKCGCTSGDESPCECWSSDEKLLIRKYVRYDIFTVDPIPETVTLLTTTYKAIEILKDLGVTQCSWSNKFFMPGVNNILEGTDGTSIFDTDKDMIYYLSRFRLPDSCDFRAVSVKERTDLEYFIAWEPHAAPTLYVSLPVCLPMILILVFLTTFIS
jgi:hypothetical protein